MDVKSSWPEQDFEEMGWHDARLYSISIPDEDFKLQFDIDYIFKWNKNNGEYQSFWVSPCNLIFLNVADFRINIDFQDNMLLFINDIRRSNKRLTPNKKFYKWDYEIECDNGLISFSATSFEQLVRKQPVLSKTQDLSRK